VTRSTLTCWLGLALFGCTHSVHQVAVGGLDDVPPGARLVQIESEAEQDVILYVTDNTDYADQAYRRLLAQCPEGRVVAIEARHSTSHGFLSFTNHVKLTGLCLSEPAPSRPRRAAAVGRDVPSGNVSVAW
jgi:hypothetical protein